MLREKERKLKYFGILEADTIKQAEMKENFFKKTTSEEQENLSKSSSTA